MMSWLIHSARVTGASHSKDGVQCQDALAVEAIEDLLIAVVADGAGSAKQSDKGSETLSQEVLSALRATKQEDEIDEKIVKNAVINAIERARTLLKNSDNPLRDYASTLVGCIYSHSAGGFFFHIGDGAAVAVRVPEWRGICVSKPSNGEFANETFFFTMDNWQSHLRWTPIPPSANLLVLMSDGPMPFVMASEQVGLFPDFAAPIDAYLAQTSTELGSAALAATIDSESAQEISSDDKTLIWAKWQDMPGK